MHIYSFIIAYLRGCGRKYMVNANICITLKLLGKYDDLSQLRFSGLSLTSARPGRVHFEISGCGARGAGRWRP